MIEVDNNIDNQPISILIDSGASHIYIDPKIVESFKIEEM
jgi:predicted aspartyl protease